MFTTAATAKSNLTMQTVICDTCEMEIPIEEAAELSGFFLCSECKKILLYGDKSMEFVYDADKPNVLKAKINKKGGVKNV